MAKKVQVKICGITNSKQAEDCAAAGADAIGLVFYGKSPRNVTIKQAQKICKAVPEHVAKVAVIVDMPILEIAEIIKQCELDAIQLHGSETPEDVVRYNDQFAADLIKHISGDCSDLLREAARYSSTTLLVEASKGVLPGGNGSTWDWSVAAKLAGEYPFILAGGLEPGNIAEAIIMAQPDAVDVSSGVEAEPGIKDIAKVKDFIQNAKAQETDRHLSICF